MRIVLRVGPLVNTILFVSDVYKEIQMKKRFYFRQILWCAGYERIPTKTVRSDTTTSSVRSCVLFFESGLLLNPILFVSDVRRFAGRQIYI